MAPHRTPLRGPQVLRDACARELLLALVVAACTSISETAVAASRILFHCEGPYLYQPGRTVKDHDLVWADGAWHLFYIRGVEGTSGTSSERELGHATSTDLRAWTIGGPALTITAESFDERNVWAPSLTRIPGSSDWTMFYTGVDASFLQRSGRANSSDLRNWTKLAPLAILEPDSTVYLWSPDLAVPQLSAFRDPFFFEDGGQYHLLHTTLLIDNSLPEGRRGAIHHLVSDDFTNWSDVGPLAVSNDFTVGRWREIESVQLIRAVGKWHLFFTYFGVEGVQWVSNDQRDTGWDLSAAITIDGGIAAEITPLAGNDFVITRHTPAQYGPGAENPGGIFYVLRADTLRFDPQTATPSVVLTDALAADFPVRSGTAFMANPTFGDNPAQRGLNGAHPSGHGYISSREFYPGPLSGIGAPGAEIGLEPTGTLLSRPFTIAADDSIMTLRVGGTPDSTKCTVALVELDSIAPGVTDTITHRVATGSLAESLREVRWPLQGLEGRTLRLRAVDASTTGWIQFDDVRILGQLSPPVSAPAAVRTDGRLLSNRPNPFNPRTMLRWTQDRTATIELEIFDVQGRRLRRVAMGSRVAGEHAWTWDGSDQNGEALASGVYLLRLRMDGEAVDTRKLTLVR